VSPSNRATEDSIWLPPPQQVSVVLVFIRTVFDGHDLIEGKEIAYLPVLNSFISVLLVPVCLMEYDGVTCCDAG